MASAAAAAAAVGRRREGSARKQAVENRAVVSPDVEPL